MADLATAFAPGRVNLIGEHTDYNDGLALPFAIEEGVTVRAQATDDGAVDVHAVDLDDRDRFALDAIEPAEGWRAFARGAAAELAATGTALRGARLTVSATVPRGSGLSSSAALEVALCLALLAVADAPVPDAVALAELCARVENDWVGADTGLLDQLASLCGEPGQAMRIDFRSRAVTPVPLRLGAWSLVILDSGETHANAGNGDGYNERRAECARACELLDVASLRDADPARIPDLPWPERGRAAHVVSEDRRVDETVQALAAGDLRRVGALLDEAHASLRDAFEISTPAVEAARERLLAAGAAGARLVGGGFGGHVLGLLAPGIAAPEGARVVVPGAGAHLLDPAGQFRLG